MQYKILWNKYKITDVVYNLLSPLDEHGDNGITVKIRVTSNYKMLRDFSKVYSISDVHVQASDGDDVLLKLDFKIYFPIEVNLTDKEEEEETKKKAGAIIEKLPVEVQDVIKLKITDIINQMTKVFGDDIGYPGEYKTLEIL